MRRFCPMESHIGTTKQNEQNKLSINKKHFASKKYFKSNTQDLRNHSTSGSEISDITAIALASHAATPE